MSARAFWRQALEGLTRSGPSYNAPPLPARSDQIEQWLKTQRDQHVDRYGQLPAWHALDDLVDLYRLHADTRTPLGEHACYAQAAGGCDCRPKPF